MPARLFGSLAQLLLRRAAMRTIRRCALTVILAIFGWAVPAQATPPLGLGGQAQEVLWNDLLALFPGVDTNRISGAGGSDFNTRLFRRLLLHNVQRGTTDPVSLRMMARRARQLGTGDLEISGSLGHSYIGYTFTRSQRFTPTTGPLPHLINIDIVDVGTCIEQLIPDAPALPRWPGFPRPVRLRALEAGFAHVFTHESSHVRYGQSIERMVLAHTMLEPGSEQFHRAVATAEMSYLDELLAQRRGFLAAGYDKATARALAETRIAGYAELAATRGMGRWEAAQFLWARAGFRIPLRALRMR